jgi:thiopurine S-methyltransferase
MDMLWLREQGYSVLGVELSPVAVRDFFAEQSLAATTQPVDGFVSSASDGLEILCGDFFDLQPKHLADVRAVYDRAALVALPQALQARYAAHLLALLPQRPPMFLLAFEYEQTEMAGPPFSTTTATVEALFGAAYQIECLFEQDVLEEQPGLRSRGLTRLVEKAYRLTAPP